MPTARSRPISRVDAGGLGLLELSPGLDLHVRIGGQGAGDGIVHGAAAVGLQDERGRRLPAEVGGEEPGADQVAADQGVGLVSRFGRSVELLSC
jgi:hypothetical protein